MITAIEALNQLKEGNQRFASDHYSPTIQTSQAKRKELLEGQAPFAVILGCSDSRVPAEVIFDQGLGSLFVIRVAGNIIAPSLVGSVEFAVSEFGTPLVIVMGHTQCGAVAATLAELERPLENRSPNLAAIVDRIRPSVMTLLETDLHKNPQELAHFAVRANVRASANQLRHASQMLEESIMAGKLMVVGAVYSLETGEVDFFDS